MNSDVNVAVNGVSDPSPTQSTPSSNSFSLIPNNGPSSTGAGVGGGGASLADLAHLQFSMVSSMGTVDMTVEEAIGNVQELMKENQDLKESLIESNKGMKKQYDLMLAWREQYETDKEQVKKRYDQAKEVVQNLQAELQDRDVKIDEILRSMKELEAEKEEEQKASQRAKDELLAQVEEYASAIQEQSVEIEQLKKASNVSADQLHLVRISLEHVEKGKQKAEEESEAVRKEMKRIDNLNSQLNVEKQDLVAMNNAMQSELHQLKSAGSSPDSPPDGAMSIGYVMIPQTVADAESCDLDAATGLGNDEPVAMATGVDDVREDVVTLLKGSDEEGKSSVMRDDDDDEDYKTLKHDEKAEQSQAITDLLIQLKEERVRSTELLEKVQALQTERETLAMKHQDSEERILQSELRMNMKLTQKDRDHQAEKEQLIAKVEELHKELQKTRGQQGGFILDNEQLKLQVQSLVSELQEANSKVESSTRAIAKYKERDDDLQSRAKMYEEDLESQRCRDDQLIDALRMTVTNMESALVAERKEHQLKSQQHEELRKSFDQLCTDYHELLDTTADMNVQKASKPAAAAAPSPPSSLREIENKYQMKLDNLTAQVMSAEESLNRKEDNIKDLKDEIEGLKQEIKNNADTNAIWKAQCDVYKIDFEAERTSREQMHTEKEQLMDKYREDVQQLQLEKQQLLDEMNTMTTQQLMEMQRKHTGVGLGPGASPPQQRRNPGFLGSPFNDGDPVNDPVDQEPNRPVERQDSFEPEHEYICPKCAYQAPDIDTLELHCVDCIQ